MGAAQNSSPGYVVSAIEGKAVARAASGWVCPECAGAGVVRRAEEEGRYPVVSPCECRTFERRLERFNRAGIPGLFANSRLDTFEIRNDSQGDAHGAASEMVRTYPLEGRGLVFLGPVGVGKTHLAAAIVRELTLEKGKSCRFCDFVQLLHDLKTAYEKREATSALLEPLTKVDVLVIDDLGKGRGTEWELDVLDDLVSRRYNADATTVCTTNHLDRELGAHERRAGFVVDTLAQRVGIRIQSRLHGMCDFHEMDGSDYRRSRRTRRGPRR